MGFLADFQVSVFLTLGQNRIFILLHIKIHKQHNIKDMLAQINTPVSFAAAAFPAVAFSD